MATLVEEKARIHLHGPIGERFGKVWEIGARTPAEAVYAIMRLRPGFAEAVRAGEWRVIYGNEIDGLDLDDGELGLQFGAVREMHLIPMAAGAKSGGVGKIILGVALVAAAVFFPETIIGGVNAVFGAGAITSTLSIGLFGGMMILSGISSMLTTQTSTPTGTASSTGMTRCSAGCSASIVGKAPRI